MRRFAVLASSYRLPPTGSRKVSQLAGKPNSVPRRRALRRFGAATTIPLGRRLLAGSSDLPGGMGRAVLIAPPYLALLRAGFCLPPTLPPARCALTAPFHPCFVTPEDATVSGMFSVPLSVRLPCPGVTRRTALRSSDFPPASAPKARRRAVVWPTATSVLSRTVHTSRFSLLGSCSDSGSAAAEAAALQVRRAHASACASNIEPNLNLNTNRAVRTEKRERRSSLSVNFLLDAVPVRASYRDCCAACR